LSDQSGSYEEYGGNLGFAKSKWGKRIQVSKGKTSSMEIKPWWIEEIGSETCVLEASSVEIQQELSTKVIGRRKRERQGGLREPGASAHPAFTGHRDHQSTSGT